MDSLYLIYAASILGAALFLACGYLLALYRREQSPLDAGALKDTRRRLEQSESARQALEQQFEENENRLLEAEAELGATTREIARSREDIKGLELELRTLQAKHKRAESQGASLLQTVAGLQRKLEQAEKKHQEFETQRARLLKTTMHLKRRLERRQQEEGAGGRGGSEQPLRPDARSRR
jgi:chromosome segregation ATPase